jgi:hypothetical protein
MALGLLKFLVLLQRMFNSVDLVSTTVDTNCVFGSGAIAALAASLQVRPTSVPFALQTLEGGE